MGSPEAAPVSTIIITKNPQFRRRICARRYMNAGFVLAVLVLGFTLLGVTLPVEVARVLHGCPNFLLRSHAAFITALFLALTSGRKQAAFIEALLFLLTSGRFSKRSLLLNKLRRCLSAKRPTPLS